MAEKSKLEEAVYRIGRANGEVQRTLGVLGDTIYEHKDALPHMSDDLRSEVQGAGDFPQAQNNSVPVNARGWVAGAHESSTELEYAISDYEAAKAGKESGDDE